MLYQVAIMSDAGMHGLLELTADECEQRFADPDVPNSVLQACDVADERGEASFLHDGLTIQIRPLGVPA